MIELSPLMIAWLADGSLLLICALAAIGLLRQLGWRRLWRVAPVVIMAGLTSLLLGKLLSLSYQPAQLRPFEILGVAPGAAYIDNPGFPSDHALFGAVVALAVLVLTDDRRLKFLLIGLLAVMAAARVVALVHTPLDVVVGLLVGVAGGLWYFKLPADARNA